MRGAAVLAAVVVVVGWAGVCTAFPQNMTKLDMEKFMAKELAPHTVISDEGAYEVREYEAAAWACVEGGRGSDMKGELMRMFIELANYIMGKNSLGTKLKMTGPFTTYKERSPQGMKMQMCFYIPSENQASPPQPTMEGVTIHKKNKMKVAARSFVAGENSYEVWGAEKLALRKALTDDGVKNINFDNYYGVMYNPPGTEDHVTEIWYQIKE